MKKDTLLKFNKIFGKYLSKNELKSAQILFEKEVEEAIEQAKSDTIHQILNEIKSKHKSRNSYPKDKVDQNFINTYNSALMDVEYLIGDYF